MPNTKFPQLDIVKMTGRHNFYEDADILARVKEMPPEGQRPALQVIAGMSVVKMTLMGKAKNSR